MPFGTSRAQGFNNPVVSKFHAGDVYMDDTGLYVYSGPRALGNLIYSVNNSLTATHDVKGNYVFPSATTYSHFGPLIIAESTFEGTVTSYMYSNPATGPANVALGFQEGFNLLGGYPNFFLWSSETPSTSDVWLVPTGDTTGLQDWENINSAFTGSYGSPINVLLMPGTYYTNQPIVVPDGMSLRGINPSWGVPTGNYGAGGLPLQGAILRCGSAYTGSQVIMMGGVGSVQHGGQRLENFTISGQGAPSGVDGIFSEGYVGGVKIRNVVVWGGGILANGFNLNNDGTPTHTADFWQIWGCKASDCTQWGIITRGFSDSWWIGCESTGNTNGGWSVTGGADTRFIGCRGDSNTGPGWSLFPTITGNLTFAGCEGNLNSTGWMFNGGTTANYFMVGCYADGNTTEYVYSSGANVVCSGGGFSVWVPLTLLNGWVNSGLGPNAEYCWRDSGWEVTGDVLAGTLVAGTAVFDLPAALDPINIQTIPILDITNRAAQGQLNVGILGTVSFFQGIGAIAATDRCYFSGKVSTDAL